MTLEYTISRSTLARWYLRSLTRNWRHLTLWLFWLLLAGLSTAVIVHAQGSGGIHSALAGLSAATLLVAFFALYPQLRYKPEKRTLTLERAGITTTIKGRSETYHWTKVARLEDDRGRFLIGLTNLNSFVVPPEAFRSAEERATLMKQCQDWWQVARSPAV